LGGALLLAGSSLGLWVAALTGPGLLVVGLIGVVLAITYTAPPCLVCRGLGDLVVAITFGILPLIGVALALTGRVPIQAWWLGSGVGCFAAAILWINAIPDIAADRAAGKMTLPVRLGPERAAQLLSLWFAAGLALILTSPLTAKVWITLLVAIPAGFASSAARAGNVAKAIPLTIATHASVCILLIAALLFAP
jgi:1,4-dihydroxy-2-naphthoate octaprenyltransferase